MPDWNEHVSHKMTPRRQQVLECLLKGMSNKAIAFELSVSQYTAETHVEDLLMIFRATNRAQLIVKYYESLPQPMSLETAKTYISYIDDHGFRAGADHYAVFTDNPKKPLYLENGAYSLDELEAIVVFLRDRERQAAETKEAAE